MSERVKELVAFTEMAFTRLDNATKDLTEKEIEWRPVPEANNIRWILTHLSWEWNVRVRQVLRGDPSYLPAGWPDDYVGNASYPLEKILGDLEGARVEALTNFHRLTAADLDADIPLWGGVRKRGFGIANYVSEANHHAGQIAFIRGAIKRRRLTDPGFLK